jgi:hypothetical protein
MLGQTVHRSSTGFLQVLVKLKKYQRIEYIG